MKEINAIVKDVETKYRDKKNKWNKRIVQINPSAVREIMLENKIGLQCEKCLTKEDAQRYCSKEHSKYYIKITNSTYGTIYPFELDTFPKGKYGYIKRKIVKCPNCEIHRAWSEMSIDHIIPIANGGLEFDRENLQFMCLECNIRKSGGKRFTINKNQKQLPIHKEIN